MRFQASLPWATGDTGVDPIANPGDVPPDQILTVPSAASQSGLGGRLAVALESGAPGETVTFDLYAVDEATLPKPDSAEPFLPAALARRRFYRVATAIVATDGVLILAGTFPLVGPFYASVSADTLGSTGVLLFGALPAT